MTAIGGHHGARARTDEWLTPPSIIDALGGWESFDLDPCSPVLRPWPTAIAHYTREQNGLLLPWHGRIWLNPPYSRPMLERFLARMAQHGRGQALIFARTETVAFFQHVWERAAALLFLRGRLNFHLPDGRRAAKNAGAPVVLVAYGTQDAELLAFSGLEGQFVPLLLAPATLVHVPSTWRQLVRSWLARQDRPVPLAEIYRALAAHPKAKGNPNYTAKIRQTLQQGPFRRLDRGLWEAT